VPASLPPLVSPATLDRFEFAMTVEPDAAWPQAEEMVDDLLAEARAHFPSGAEPYLRGVFQACAVDWPLTSGLLLAVLECRTANWTAKEAEGTGEQP